MKKLLLLLMLFQVLIGNAQSFEFNYILNSENTRENEKLNYKSYDMVNSNNHNLYMEVGQNTITKNSYSILLDYSGKNVYKFNVNRKANNQLFFDYQTGFPMSGKLHRRNTSFKIEKIGNLAYRIYTSKDAKRRLKDFELFITLEPFADDLIIINFEIFAKDQMNLVENLIKDELQKDGKIGNFYIKEITYKYFKNAVLTKKIKPEKIALLIDIPKEK